MQTKKDRHGPCSEGFYLLFWLNSSIASLLLCRLWCLSGGDPQQASLLAALENAMLVSWQSQQRGHISVAETKAVREHLSVALPGSHPMLV